MSRRYSSSRSTLSRLYGIGGADLALRYHELSEGTRANSTPDRTPRRAIYINGARISDEDVGTMERVWNTALRDGRYWYDRANGACGVEGGPCTGFIPAGLPLGGPLMANASGGGTGVFINGRELHPQDLFALTRVMPVWPGRYWMDAVGNFGWEGGPPVGNLVAAMQRPGAQGGPWAALSRAGTVGGDGDGFLFFSDGKTSWST
ncbi:MAG TPA: hypothetical protein PLN31_20475 [Azoarcus taiwanensis]|nr:hypothetical protein [Azoarcus taiwanensis]